MFAIEVDLLGRRYTARAFDGRHAPEWPPHPARLYSAMVSAWADADAPDDEERSALRWLESLDAPSITCAGGTAVLQRTSVTHFVPVNDARSLRRDLSGVYGRLVDAERALLAATDARSVAKAGAGMSKAVAKARSDGAAAGAPGPDVSDQIVSDVVSVLPDGRRKQGRWYPTVRIDAASASIRFEWGEANPAADVASSLDAILSRVARLGHSSTFVSCRVAGSAAGLPRGATTWRAGGSHSEGGVHVRLPRAGSLDHLQRLYSQHQGQEPRTLPSDWAVYRATKEAKPVPPAPVLAGPWRVLAFPKERRVRLTRTLDVARAVRGALLSASADAPSPMIHGHRGEGSAAPSDQPHLAILPLANVGSPYADGVVHGVALVLPRGATAADEGVLERALASWRDRSQGQVSLHLGGQTINLIDRGADHDDATTAAGPNSQRILERWYWSRPSRRWATVTPIALDRFPGPPGAPDWEERAAATIAGSCLNIGLPVPAEVEVVWGPPMRGVPAAGPRHATPASGVRFGGYRAGSSGQVRLCVHARLRFEEPVRGPVLLGAGRYAGYGLCLPVRVQEAE